MLGCGIFWRVKLAILMVLAFLSMAAQPPVQYKNPIDAGLEECIEKCDKSSCLGIAYTKWNEELDRAYANLMEIMIKDDVCKEELKKSQQDWISNKDSQMDSIGKTFEGTTADEQIVELYRQRVLQLKDYSGKNCGTVSSGKTKSGSSGNEPEKVSFADGYFQKGLVLYSHRAYQAACVEFNAAIALDPNNAEYYFARGEAKSSSGSLSAMEDYTKAIELNNDLAIAYSGRGMIRNSLEQYALALEDLNKAISIDPKNVDSYKARGYTYYYLDKIEQMCLDYKKACDLGDCRKFNDVKSYGRCK